MEATPEELAEINVHEVRTYTQVEDIRQRLNSSGGRGNGGDFSQAFVCRCAGLNQSTYTKGLQANRAPTPTNRNHLKRVLEARRIYLLEEMKHERGDTHDK